MGKLRDMVERPHSGLPGKIFACLSVLFVTITAVNLSISTMPAMREEEEAVSGDDIYITESYRVQKEHIFTPEQKCFH